MWGTSMSSGAEVVELRTPTAVLADAHGDRRRGMVGRVRHVGQSIV